jgi:hypothetical protein
MIDAEPETYDEQLARILDRTPAAELGLTMLDACVAFAMPYREMWRAYVIGFSRNVPPVGRRDHWDVWWAPRADVAAVFAPRPAQTALKPAAVQRTEAKAAALRRKLGLEP